MASIVYEQPPPLISILSWTDVYSNFNYTKATERPMDCLKVYFPFLPSVLFPLNFITLGQPAQSACHQEILSCGQTSGAGIKCRVYSLENVCHYFKCFLQHLYLTSGILAPQHVLTAIDFQCQRVTVTNNHTNKTVT